MSIASHNPRQWIEESQGLVRALATKIRRGAPDHVDLDDLIGYGQIGLAEAARDFDPARGVQFATFAYYRIRGAIYDGLSKMSWFSRSQYNRMRFEQMANEALRLEGEDPPPAEPRRVEDEVRWLKSVTSALAVVYLSTLRTKDDDGEGQQLEDHSAEAPSAAIVRGETRAKLHELIDQLPHESSFLIKATYFEGLTLTEAGQQIGVSKAWASRLHARALEKLARSLRLLGWGD